MSRKYLELFTDSFDESIQEKTKLENKPYVAYSTKEDKVIFTVVIEPEQPSLYEAVDLGLPSGLKWANMNVGATSPEDTGLYFQWGDTVGYSSDQVGKDKVFNWDSYWDTTDGGVTFNKYNGGGLTQLESVDDAATTHMGSDWRMPTQTEFQELINNTIHTFIDLQGNEFTQTEVYNGAIQEYGNFKGIRLTGSNGNSIFIPTCGNCEDDIFYGIGEYSYLWSSSLCEHNLDLGGGLNFDQGGSLNAGNNMGVRYLGLSVRGVKA